LPGKIPGKAILVVEALEPVREIHVARLMIPDETTGMTAALTLAVADVAGRIIIDHGQGRVGALLRRPRSLSHLWIFCINMQKIPIIRHPFGVCKV
jgi:hypothetical protein